MCANKLFGPQATKNADTEKNGKFSHKICVNI